MADLANVLLRSIARAFYAPEQVVILDAVLHSALRDDDLALLMGGQQTKHLRKTCSKLVEDGLLTVHSRPEQRLGATRTFSKDYYYVNTHRAIDVVKYRVKRIHKAVEKKYGQAPEEKKEYSCATCKAFYTQLEVLDNVGPAGFLCKRCGSILDPIEDDDTAGAGHEVQSRLNQQMAVFEKMLAEIDNAEVPEQDFDTAIAKALPVKRDESINPGSRSEPVPMGGAGAPATVRGRHIGEERVEISLLDEDERKAEEAAEAARRAKLAEQNQLPSWHTASTVGMGVRTNGSAVAAAGDGNGVKADEGEDKKASELLRGEDEKEDSKAALDQIFATLHQASEDEDDDSSDDSDDDEDEDDDDEEAPAAKKARIVEPETSTGTPVKSEDESSNESS